MWPRRRARDQAWQRNEAGAIAIYVALMLPFLVGLALLVVDGGRLAGCYVHGLFADDRQRRDWRSSANRPCKIGRAHV